MDLRLDRDGASPWPDSVRTFNHPLVEFDAPSPGTLNDVSKHVATLIQDGEVVYVHCRAGVQRAPMVACAVLMQMGWPLADSYRVVGSRRSVAALTEAQLETLRVLESTLRPVGTGG